LGENLKKAMFDTGICLADYNPRGKLFVFINFLGGLEEVFGCCYGTLNLLFFVSLFYINTYKHLSTLPCLAKLPILTKEIQTLFPIRVLLELLILPILPIMAGTARFIVVLVKIVILANRAS